MEDSVAVSEKDKARQLIKITLEQLETINSKIYIRINELKKEGWVQDVEQSIGLKINGYFLPKVDGPEDIKEMDRLLENVKKMRPSNSPSIEIIPLVESALGVWQSLDIARASPRVSRLAFGAVDFSLDINTSWTKEGLECLFAKSWLVLSSRIANIEPPIDSVFPDLNDDIGLVKETTAGKQMGYFGKLAIHPKQISLIKKVYQPTDEEILTAQKIVESFKLAESSGLGAIQLDGKLVDYAVFKRAQKILKISKSDFGNS